MRRQAEAGMKSVDAPVSGGVGGASTGWRHLHDRRRNRYHVRKTTKSILAAMGKKLVHCGEAGAGQAAKICNNMILGISMIAVSEAFVLGEKLGLSHQALFDVASTSSGQCWSLTSYCPVPGPVATREANNAYRPGFAAPADAEGFETRRRKPLTMYPPPTAMGRHAARIYEEFVAAGGEAADLGRHQFHPRRLPEPDKMAEIQLPAYETILVELRGRVDACDPQSTAGDERAQRSALHATDRRVGTAAEATRSAAL